MQAFLWCLLAWGWAVSRGLLALPNLKHANEPRSLETLEFSKSASSLTFNAKHEISQHWPRVVVSDLQERTRNALSLNRSASWVDLFASLFGRQRVASVPVSPNMRFALHTVSYFERRRLCWKAANRESHGQNDALWNLRITFTWSMPHPSFVSYH